MQFKELSYANENDRRLKRWFIRSMEGLAGRNRYVKLYARWQSDVVGKSDRIFGEMLKLIDVRLRLQGEWPPRHLPDTPWLSLPIIPSASAMALPFWRLPSNSAGRFGC